MQISYFAVMDNPEDEAALNAELARLRAIEAAARDSARQIDELADRLLSSVRPGHCDYINRTRAGAWAQRLATKLRAALEVKP